MNTGRRVVITAAASGIGLALAETFAANGDRVHICDINEQALGKITEGNSAITATVCDVSNRSSVEALRSIQRQRTHLFYAGNAFLTRESRHGVPGTYLGTNLSQAADVISAFITAEYDGEGLTA